MTGTVHCPPGIIPGTGNTPAVKPPPIGVTPRFIHDERRAAELMAAIVRFLESGQPVHVEWYDELVELLTRNRQHRNLRNMLGIKTHPNT
jgi:hypothetical protein